MPVVLESPWGSKATQKHRFVAVGVEGLAEDMLLLRRMQATDHLGQLFEYRLELLSENCEIDLDKVLGRNMTVRVETITEGAGTRYFNGFVSHFRYAGIQGRHAVYRAVLRPWMPAYLAMELGENLDQSKRQASQSYYDIFEQIESDLLRIAVLLKHPSFQEEAEWRIVSPVITDYVTSPVLFREGTSMLVPYFEFKLAPSQNEPIDLEHIFLGPTPNISLSMNSLALYLAKKGIRPREGISYCQIPYRQW
jgi:hypothetical protein